MRRLLIERPVRGALVLQVAFMVAVFVGGLIGAVAHHFLVDTKSGPPDWLTLTAGYIAGGLFLAWLVTRLGWWQQVTGWRPLLRVDARLWALVAAPLILALVIDAATVTSRRPLSLVVGLELVLELATAAIAEELLFRGVILSALAARGAPLAVPISALLFALFHLTNVALFPFAAVAAEMVFAFGAGAVWAVARLRGGALWALIVAHFLVDMLGYMLGYSLNNITTVFLSGQFAVGLTLAAIAAVVFMSGPRAAMEGSHNR